MTQSPMAEASVLAEISPGALSAYVRARQWTSTEEFGDHSDVYTGPGLPELIIPRTREISDYIIVMAQILEILSTVEDSTPQAVLRRLRHADRDVFRLRAHLYNQELPSIDDGAELVSGARNMLLAAAASWKDRRPVLRPGLNQDATRFVNSVALGHTEEGSFAITMLTPVIAPPIRKPMPGLGLEDLPENDPQERRLSRHIHESLVSAQRATQEIAAGRSDALDNAVASGVNANLCEALAQLADPFIRTEINISWAVTRPRPKDGGTITFLGEAGPVLREMASTFRETGPRPDQKIVGRVVRLARDEQAVEGTITLRADIDGRAQSVTAILSPDEYSKAIAAHQGMIVLGLEGDLERTGARWHLRNPRITDVIAEDEEIQE